MLKKLSDTQLVRFEPDLHATWLYHWYYSGMYPEFYREWATCPSMAELAAAAAGKSFMILNDKKQVVGLVMFFNVSENSRRAEVAVMVDKAFEAKGFGVKAFKILTYYLMNTMNLFKVRVSVMERNHRLNKIMKKVGAVQEGSLRKEAYLEGEFHNVSLWSMTKGEFNKKYKSEIEGLIGEKPGGEMPVEDINGQERTETIQTIPGPAVRIAGAAA